MNIIQIDANYRIQIIEGAKPYMPQVREFAFNGAEEMWCVWGNRTATKFKTEAQARAFIESKREESNV